GERELVAAPRRSAVARRERDAALPGVDLVGRSAGWNDEGTGEEMGGIPWLHGQVRLGEAPRCRFACNPDDPGHDYAPRLRARRDTRREDDGEQDGAGAHAAIMQVKPFRAGGVFLCSA